jgi:hypothetical protein
LKNVRSVDADDVTSHWLDNKNFNSKNRQWLSMWTCVKKNSWSYLRIIEWLLLFWTIRFVILLKNALNLSKLARHKRNEVLICIMWKIIISRNVFKLIDFIEVVLLISKVILTNLIVIWSSCNLINYCRQNLELIDLVNKTNNDVEID